MSAETEGIEAEQASRFALTFSLDRAMRYESLSSHMPALDAGPMDSPLSLGHISSRDSSSWEPPVDDTCARSAGAKLAATRVVPGDAPAFVSPFRLRFPPQRLASTRIASLTSRRALRGMDKGAPSALSHPHLLAVCAVEDTAVWAHRLAPTRRQSSRCRR